MENSYSKWTPGNPCMSWYIHVLCIGHILILFTACDSSSCSSGKVAGLVFFETFSFLWTSQVICNVSLATLAGGPYGSWYYFGPRELGVMVRRLSGDKLANLLTDSHSPNIRRYLRSGVHHLSLWDQLHLALWLLLSWTYWGWFWMRRRIMQMQMVIVSSTYQDHLG